MNVERPRFGLPAGLYSPPPALAHAEAFALGPLAVEPPLRRVVGADGAPVTLEPLAMQVLIALAEAAGAPLTRDDLVERCWGPRIVGDDAVNRVISALRRALAAAAGEAVTIETIPKVGYRLRVTEGAASRPVAPPRRRRLLALAGVAAATAGALFAYTGSHGAAAEPVTIAIEPVRGGGGGDGEARRFADYLTADVSRLAASATRINMVDRGAGGASADMLVRVSVLRDARRLVARVRLVDAKGAIVWSQDFDDPAGSAEQLRERTALGIAAVVRCGLDRPAALYDDPVSKRLYFGACDAVAARDAHRAQSLARQIVALKPKVATGWAMLATTTLAIMQGGDYDPAVVRAAREQAEHAIALDPEAGCGHWALAFAIEAEGGQPLAEIERAVALDPDHPWLAMDHARALFEAGYVEASVAPALRSLALDPTSRTSSEATVRRLLAAGRTDEALALQQRVEQLWGGEPEVRAQRRTMLRFERDPRRALESFDRASGAGPDPDQLSRLELEWNANRAGFDWRRFDREAEAQFRGDPGAAWALAAFATRMGDIDRAVAWLARAPGERAKAQWSLLFWPEVAPLRRDPRFFAAMDRLGLVRLWRQRGQWPDFCGEPGLRYDCRREAARLGAGIRPAI